jgi:hypothetical protein
MEQINQISQIDIDDNKYSNYQDYYDFYNFEEGLLDYRHFISNDGRTNFLMDIGYIENNNIKNDRL